MDDEPPSATELGSSLLEHAAYTKRRRTPERGREVMCRLVE